jgi:F0F1-type ATP synthase membrane subunit b/b'
MNINFKNEFNLIIAFIIIIQFCNDYKYSELKNFIKKKIQKFQLYLLYLIGKDIYLGF